MNSDTMSPWSSLLVLVLLLAGQHLANAGQRMSTAGQHMAIVGQRIEDAQLVVQACNIKAHLFRGHSAYRPSGYKLQLELNPRESTFSGKVDIDLNIADKVEDKKYQRRVLANEFPLEQDPRNIFLNAEDLRVKNLEFHQNRDLAVVTRVCHDARKNILVVTLSKIPSSRGGATLTFSFKGRVQKEAKGLFRSSVGSSHALVTHLKPAFARRLFPCFDEPRFKATFELTIVHPPGTSALSNMPIIKHETPPNDSATTQFKATPKMSSYLLSLAVGEFESIGDDERIGDPLDGTKIAIHAPKGTRCADHMLGTAVKAYDKVRGFFADLPQPLEKIDIVAVNMNQGAMEGWGLITMRRDLLCEELAKPEDRLHAVTGLTNQIVRFWLGNLVTVNLWDDLWFMEGLANYVTAELTSELHPEMSSELLTLISTTYSAMNDDDNPQKSPPISGPQLRRHAHPLTVGDIEKSYDSIIYKKSEAIFRMFAQFISKEKFNLAIRELIRTKAYDSSDDDTWMIRLAHFARAYKMPGYHTTGDWLMSIMVGRWTSQAGYPIITASINEEGKLVVSQESNLGNDDLWPVPISYKLYTGPNEVYSQVYVLIEESKTIDSRFNLESGQDWIKLNVDYQGYYRAIYETESLWKALIRALERGDVRPADQLQLLSDSYAQSKRAGAMDHFGELLKLLSEKEQTNDGVMLLLTRMATELHACGKLTSDLSEVFTKLMINYHNTNKGISGEAGSDVLSQYARGEVLDYLVNRLEERSVIEEAQKYMREKGNWPPFLAHVLGRFRSRN